MVDNGEKLQQALRQRLGDDFAWSILGSVGYGVTAIAYDGRFIYSNSAYAKMVGYTVEEIIGNKPHKFTHPDDIPELNKAAQKTVEVAV